MEPVINSRSYRTPPPEPTQSSSITSMTAQQLFFRAARLAEHHRHGGEYVFEFRQPKRSLIGGELWLFPRFGRRHSRAGQFGASGPGRLVFGKARARQKRQKRAPLHFSFRAKPPPEEGVWLHSCGNAGCRRSTGDACRAGIARSRFCHGEDKAGQMRE